MKIDRTILETYIDPFLRGELEEQQALHRLLCLSVGRVLQKDTKVSSDVDIQGEQIKHIVDWLLAAIRNNENWLANVDTNGNPKKLMKFGSLTQIITEADKAMRISAQKSARIVLQEGDEELFSVFDDGNFIVRLLTPEALDAETAVMQHCIGNGAYDDMLRSSKNLFLSIRDKTGKPHVTLHVSNGEVLQVQGKQNKPPLKKYMQLVAKALKQNDFKMNANTAVLGYVIDSSFNVHLLNEIPEGAHFPADQDWSYAVIRHLPDDLTFEGNFKAQYAEFEVLPKGLTVKGNLDVYRSDIKLVHASLQVGGDLNASYSKLLSIPDGVNIGGSIDAANSRLLFLPNKLEVNGSLTLCNCPIVELPETLIITNNLDIFGTNIRKVPGSVRIGGSFDIRGTQIHELPTDLEVPGILWVEHTPLVKLPDGLKVGEIADIRSTRKICIGDNTQITHDLNLNRSSIKRLPKNLKVGGRLLLADSKIDEIPEGTFVGKFIDISGTNVIEVPSSIPDTCKISNGRKETSALEFRRYQDVKIFFKSVFGMAM
jgi:hypothetical protein